MLTISLIRTHIDKVPAEHLFTTRDMLLYGTRGAVDQALNRLVRMGEISRIARGVFVKPSTESSRTDRDTIALIKAHASGKHNPKATCPRCHAASPG